MPYWTCYQIVQEASSYGYCSDIISKVLVCNINETVWHRGMCLLRGFEVW